jgi:radical SAM superfamily enzyme YgiQ (UPF0313 family)
MTYWYPGMVHVIKLVKDKFPQVPVILGGIYATLCHDHAVHHSGADYVLPGESEIECVRLVDKLTGNQSSFEPDQTDLDSYPYPAFDLLRNRTYICILTSRGCPYRCRYCASQLISPQWRKRKPELVVAEIEYWHGNYGVRNFVFYDDALTVNLETQFIPLLEMIITKNLDLNFHTPNGIHARGISNKVARLMHRAGFKTIRLGLESCDATFQSTTGNKITTAEFQNTVMNLRHAGYSSDQIGVYLLAGLPNQSVKEVKKSVRFVQSCGARPYLSEYSPIPGTALWQQAVAASSFDIASDPLWHNNSIFPCQWSGLTVDQLHQVKLLLRNKSR